jgi:hypothetical protein
MLANHAHAQGGNSAHASPPLLFSKADAATPPAEGPKSSHKGSDATIDPQRLPAFLQRVMRSVAEEERLIDSLCLAVIESRWKDAQAAVTHLAERRALPVTSQQPL